MGVLTGLDALPVTTELPLQEAERFNAARVNWAGEAPVSEATITLMSFFLFKGPSRPQGGTP